MGNTLENTNNVKSEVVTQESLNRFNKTFPTTPVKEGVKHRILIRAQRINYNIYQHDKFYDVKKCLVKFSRREKYKVWNDNRGEYHNTQEANEILEETLAITYNLNDAYISEVKDVRDMWNVAKLDNKNLGDLFSFLDFHKLKNAVTPKEDPNRITTIEEFPEDEDGVETLYKDEEILLVKINSYEASRNYCHNYGMTAPWCISYTNNRSHWDRHVDEKGNKFVFLLNKSGDKYAFVYNEEDHEIYNRQDQLTSSYKLVKNHPEIVEPLRKAGAVSVNKAEDMKAEPTLFKTKKGEFKGTTVVETNTGIGDISGTITSYLDENDEYLDVEKHNHPAMKVG